MDKEFITYEQALALKELGFDEPCMAWYDTRKPDVSLNTSHYHSGKWNYLENAVSLPLYQQAFRWFRENHDIQGYIYSSTVRGNVEKTKQFTGYIWNINGIDMPFLSTDARDELHDTYEEAESACLDKLIEIVNTFEKRRQWVK
jgi:hypothetical protein